MDDSKTLIIPDQDPGNQNDHPEFDDHQKQDLKQDTESVEMVN